MPLSRAQIVDAALSTLRVHGLGGLSMRRLAHDLGVQPGALYWHIASKQELLAAVAERILPSTISTTDARQAACDIRSALLESRDGAEVISFVYAFKPDGLVPLRQLRDLFAEGFSAQQAEWAAQTLIHFVLGSVTEEQNHAELVRAKILPDDSRTSRPADAFDFGLDAILLGLTATTAKKHKPPARKRAAPRP